MKNNQIWTSEKVLAQQILNIISNSNVMKIEYKETIDQIEKVIKKVLE